VWIDWEGDVTARQFNSSGNWTAVSASVNLIWEETSPNKQLRLRSQISGTDATASEPAFLMSTNSALGADDMVLGVRRNTATFPLTVDWEGDTVVGGGLKVNSLANAKPTCNSGAQGTFFYVAGGAGVKDTVEVCAKDAADAYAWRAIY
jgi:hypothetical protein